MEGRRQGDTRAGWITIAAVSVVAYTLATVCHEAIGHGGACVLVGCKPRLVTAMQFRGDESGLSPAAVRVIAAGGTIVNLVMAALAIAWRIAARRASDAMWLFLWTFATINLLHACGYWLYSGVANIGDWSDVVRTWRPAWAWRVGLSVLGGASYWFAVRWSMSELGRRLSVETNARPREANRYTLIAFATGGLLEMGAGLFEPGGGFIVLISGAAASLGGASGLAWGPQLLHDPKLGVPSEAPLVITRRFGWVLAGVIAAVWFVFVLGRGIPLGH